MTPPIAALFDMDRTVLRIDTAMSWTRFLHARGELPASMLAKAVYWSTLYKLAVLDMEAVFARLTRDLAGDAEAEMIAMCDAWFRAHVEPEIAPAARVAIAAHARAGHVVALATGSTIYAASPVARAVGIAPEHVLASRLELDRPGAADAAFTGRASALCFGTHKVVLVEQWAGARGIDLARSYFYSDSYNDLPMLARVGNPVAINPDARLLREARRRGWPTARWA